MNTRVFLFGAAFLSTILGMSGCFPAVSVEQSAISLEGARFVLDDEPEGAIHVAKAKNAVKENKVVVVTGRISAGNNEPWDQGNAAFLISDASVNEDEGHGGDKGHDAENCPFCKRRKAARVLVQFLDEDDNVLEIDARDLLGLKKNQLVVVRGEGEIDDNLGILTVSAEGIFFPDES